MLGEGPARNLQRDSTLLLEGRPQLLLLQAKPRWLGQLLSLRRRGARIRVAGGDWSRAQHARSLSLPENQGLQGAAFVPLRLSARCQRRGVLP